MPLDLHPLIGTWRSLEETISVVEYSVDRKDEVFSVTAVDSYDGEVGEVNGTQWDEQKAELSFNCYWASSGRYSKCKMLLFSDNKVQFTFTYTDHEILMRKSE